MGGAFPGEGSFSLSREDRMRQRGFETVRAYLGQGIHLPQRRTAGSAGYDIETAEAVSVEPGELVLVPTGVKAYMQPDEVLQIYVRSSIAMRHKLSLANSVGIIDADYYNNEENEGHILIALVNHGKETVHLAKGTRMAQGIFTRYLAADGDRAGEGAARAGGFGSTGER